MSPASQNWAGSNIDIAVGDQVVLEAYSNLPADGDPTVPSPPADITWTILSAPEGTTYNQGWFAGAGGGVVGVNPLAPGPPSFTPDKEGTWLIRCTNTVTVETVDVVIGILQQRTGIRIPAAGETNQADSDTHNHNYPPLPSGSPAAMGWAKDRNYALDVFDDFITSGGLQVCYFNDAGGLGGGPWGGTLKAGAAVAIDAATPTYPLASGEVVPQIKLANGNTEEGCIGLVKCGWIPGPLTPDGILTDQRVYPKVISTDAIPNETLVLVSRAGSVSVGAAGILDTTGIAPGTVLYLGPTSGLLQAGTDRFAMISAGLTPTDYVVPVAITTDQNASPTVVVVPSEYWGGSSAVDECFRYKGLGDFRGVRIGGPESTQVAGEERGAIEMIAICKESGGLTAGDICMLNTTSPTEVYAYRADATYAGADTTATRGMVGVCVETVGFDVTGHFVIYGNALATVSPTVSGSSFSRRLYVGSSDNPAGSQAGQAVDISEVGSRTASETTLNRLISIGTWVDNTGGATHHIMVGGTGTAEGYVERLYGYQGLDTLGYQDGDWNTLLPSNLQTTGGVSRVALQDTAVNLVGGKHADGRSDWTGLKIVGSGADDTLAEIDIFEARIPGTALWNISATNDALSGTVSVTHNIAGSVLPSGGGTLFGTVALDNRILTGAALLGKANNNPVYLKVYGYLDGDAGPMQPELRAWVRLNVPSITGMPTEDYAATEYPYLTSMIPVINDDNGFWSPYADGGLATEYRGFAIKIPLSASGFNSPTSPTDWVATSRSELGVVSSQTSTNTATPVSSLGGGVAGEFDRPVETIDITLQNEGADNFIVTQVVLKTDPYVVGEKRWFDPGQAPTRQNYRTSTFYEVSCPAYAIPAQNENTGANGTIRVEGFFKCNLGSS